MKAILSGAIRASRRAATPSMIRRVGDTGNARGSPLKEYFVLVWDRRDADRSKVKTNDLTSPVFSFVGEVLDKEATDPGATVTGNSFACYALNEEDVEAKMRSSAYFKEGIWDISTAKISALETVHTSPYENKEMEAQ